MKNPNLCQRPFCREPYTKIVSGCNRFRHRVWILQVCDTHAKPYEEIRDPSEPHWIQVRNRK
jgi:hypothetical protein